MKRAKNYFMTAGILLYILSIFMFIKIYSGGTTNVSNNTHVQAANLSFGALVLGDTTRQTSTPIVNITITQSPTSEPGQKAFINENYLLNKINVYRNENGKSNLVASKEACDFAQHRSAEISTNFSHAGFESRRDSDLLPFPNWETAVENIAISSENNVIEMWKNSPTHNANLLADISYGCVENEGNYYVFEGWN